MQTLQRHTENSAILMFLTGSLEYIRFVNGFSLRVLYCYADWLEPLSIILLLLYRMKGEENCYHN